MIKRGMEIESHECYSMEDLCSTLFFYGRKRVSGLSQSVGL